MRQRVISIILLFFLITSPLFASYEEEDKDNYYTSVAELATNGAFISFIARTADMVLEKLKDAVTPGIVRLSYDRKTDSKNDSTETVNVALARPQSFIGMLLTALLTLECLVLGIKSFLGYSGNFQDIIKHFLLIAITLAFIAVLPIIADSLLNIFTTIGVIAGGGSIDKNEIFAFRPSTVIELFGNIKNSLDLTRASLSGSIIAKIPYILIIYISLVIIAIPFCIVSVLVIFWYLEFSFIVLAGTVLLPFTVFSYTSITDMKTILKALLLEGTKIFLGVFIATLVGNVLKDTLKSLNTTAGGVLNLIVYMLLMTVIFVFGITKGPECVFNAISGNVSSSLGGKESFGFAMGAVGALSVLGSLRKNKETVPLSPCTPPSEPVASILPLPPQDAPKDPPQNQPSSPQDEPEKDEAQKPDEPPLIPTIVPKFPQRETNYITCNATTKRVALANAAFEREGVKSVSMDEAKERARWDATYSVLTKMQKKDFKNKDGEIDKEAKKQYERMTKERYGYTKGLTTWRGDEIKK